MVFLQEAHTAGIPSSIQIKPEADKSFDIIGVYPNGSRGQVDGEGTASNLLYVGYDGTYQQTTSALRFNLGNIDQRTTIKSVTLSLYVRQARTSGVADEFNPFVEVYGSNDISWPEVDGPVTPPPTTDHIYSSQGEGVEIESNKRLKYGRHKLCKVKNQYPYR